jgi:hypothetical protein
VSGKVVEVSVLHVEIVKTPVVVGVNFHHIDLVVEDVLDKQDGCGSEAEVVASVTSTKLGVRLASPVSVITTASWHRSLPGGAAKMKLKLEKGHFIFVRRFGR